MSKLMSPATGRIYGVQRVCQVFRFPRSTLYAQEKREAMPESPKAKRGPKLLYSDKELLALIRTDLERSPFCGEGHRKVWARLKYGLGLSVGRKRVLRLMREHNLLSPYRRPQAPPRAHDGQIITQAPNVMWGVDGTRIFTVEDGYVWIFTAVEHWNAQCMGCHITKKGDRFAALEPVAQAVSEQFGHVGSDAARGLTLRMDHGTQYLSNHFQNQLKFWGIAPSFSFIEQPQTNGVAERFFRTLKEQVIYGRIYHTVEELRHAVYKFIDSYNRQWCVEKNGFLSPLQMRSTWTMKVAV